MDAARRFDAIPHPMPPRALVLVLLAGCGAMYAEPGPPPPADPAASWQRLVSARDLDGAVVGETPDRATIAIVFASWCGYCRAEIVDELSTVRAHHDDVRIVGVNFRRHEEYDRRGDSAAVRAFVAETAPWLQVVPGDEAMFRAFGSPTYIPQVYVFDAHGALVKIYDRDQRDPPTARELDGLIAGLAE